MTPTLPLDTATCPLGELTQYVRDTHHAYLRDELPALWQLMREAVASAAPPARAELRALGRCFGQFRSTLENHLRKEEEVLFPFVEDLERRLSAGGAPPKHAFGPLALPIEILEVEHAFGDRLLDRMRPIWCRWTPDSESSPLQQSLRRRLLLLESDMQRHVHVEDTILFPRTVELEQRR